MKHDIVGLAIFLLEFVEFAFFLLVLIGDGFEGILNAKEFPFLLLKFAGIVVDLPL